MQSNQTSLPVTQGSESTKGAKKKVSNNYGSGSNLATIGATNHAPMTPQSMAHNYSNPVMVFHIKSDRKDEKFVIARDYLKSLKQSEFYMI
jgi:hypothetical protein